MKGTILMLIFLWATSLWAQDLGVHFSVLKESFYYPSHHLVTGPIHPGIQAGVMIPTKKLNRYWDASAGFYHHSHFQNSLFLLGGYHFQYAISDGLSWNWGPKIGYIHTFSPTGTFVHDGEQYVRKRGGRPSALMGLSAGLSYKFTESISANTSIQTLIEGPFAPYWGVPVAPHSMISLGLTYYISKP
ncbi:MAG: hypothetical protein JXQ90_02420 [Cyclobacteriaceae bacterium]